MDWLKVKNNNKHIAILGEYGQGKSVLSLKITYNLINDKTENNRIPILIPLRGKSPRNLNALEIISLWSSNYNINAKSILKLHKSGRLLFIFEGFDEMDLIGHSEIRLSHFQRLWEFATKDSKILITGRPNFFLDTKELEIALGTKPQINGIPYCEPVYLNPFSFDQIENALRKCKDHIKNEILYFLKDQETSKNFYDLVSRPSMLFLVSQIWESRKLNENKNKINSALVIQEFLQSTYSRQHNKNSEIKYTVLNFNEREYFMIGIAIGMQKLNSYSNQISKNNLQMLVNELYENFPDEISKIPTAFDFVVNKTLKERMKDYPHAEESILTDVRSCGVLVTDLSRLDHFKFSHKSFYELLIAQYYAHLILKKNEKYTMIVNSISRTLIVNLTHLRNFESLNFISELLLSELNFTLSNDQEKDCKSLFRVICNKSLLNKSPRLAYMFNKYFLRDSFTTILTLVFSIIITSILRIDKYDLNKLSIWIMIPLLIVMFLIASVSSLTVIRKIYKVKAKDLINSPSYISRCLEIWRLCCKSLKVNENILRKIDPEYDKINKSLIKIIRGFFQRNTPHQRNI